MKTTVKATQPIDLTTYHCDLCGDEREHTFLLGMQLRTYSCPKPIVDGNSPVADKHICIYCARAIELYCKEHSLHEKQCRHLGRPIPPPNDIETTKGFWFTKFFAST